MQDSRSPYKQAAIDTRDAAERVLLTKGVGYVLLAVSMLAVIAAMCATGPVLLLGAVALTISCGIAGLLSLAFSEYLRKYI